MATTSTSALFTRSWVLSNSADVDVVRSEEHTSELQSQSNLVCRLLLEKKKKQALDSHSRSGSEATYCYAQPRDAPPCNPPLDSSVPTVPPPRSDRPSTFHTVRRLPQVHLLNA